MGIALEASSRVSHSSGSTRMELPHGKVPGRWAWPISTAETPQKGSFALSDTGSYETPPKDPAPRYNVLQEIPTPQRKAQSNAKRAEEETPKPPSSQPPRLILESSQELPRPQLAALTDFSVLSPFLGAEAAQSSLEELPIPARRALQFIRHLNNELPRTPCSGRGFLPAERYSQPTLILDLDETLVHCSRAEQGRAGEDKKVSKTPPQMYVHFEDAPHEGSVRWRPFAQLFLSVVAKRFEVVVFTASDQAYADQVIDQLDPNGFIKYRLYRQHCTQVRGAFFKECGLLGRPLSRCILVDNSPISVACNADNGILIKSWYGDAFDRELIDLLPILDDATAYPDVTKYFAARYGLREFFEGLSDRQSI